MNKVLLLGNLTREPELKKSASGKYVLDFTIATNEGKTSSGEDISQFTTCRAWEKTAENIANFFSKGSKILIEGRIRTDVQDTPNGKKYYTYVLADRFEFVQAKEKTASLNPIPSYEKPNEVKVDSEALPFY